MAWTKTFAGDAPERVNKWLAQAGVCSRREAEAFIADGLVFIDGDRVEDPGRKIAPGQTLTLEAAAQDTLAARTTAVLNKPAGIVSAQPERGQTPAVRLLTKANALGDATALNAQALAPVGRLDQDSRGLLLLSDDGVLAKAIIGPQAKIDKEYLVRVEGAITRRALGLLREGLTLDGRTLKRAEVDEIGPQRLRFVLREGRNRQIRRMCKAVDLRVVDLLRVRIGPVRLGDLPEGRWRPLTEKERGAILAAA
ncbi:MAG: pseudouridine synthase [Alphaproteobacteria bacterium]|nr:pseudouridine synthase [Alphaproteobacteria bacterium]